MKIGHVYKKNTTVIISPLFTMKTNIVTSVNNENNVHMKNYLLTPFY